MPDATPTLTTTHDPTTYPARGEVLHGRRVWALGEDGEMGLMVEGHGLRALAAANAHGRGMDGPRWYAGWDSHVRLWVERLWVVFHESCGCTRKEHDDKHVSHVDRTGEGCDCAHPGLPPCEEERFAWVFEQVKEGTAGSLPVTEVAW